MLLPFGTYLLLLCAPPRSARFPYTTLFRSMSLRVSAPRALISACSGLMYSMVPTMVPYWVNRVRSVNFCSVALATPKRSEEHTSELQSRGHLVCPLLLEKKKHYSNDTRRAR